MIKIGCIFVQFLNDLEVALTSEDIHRTWSADRWLVKNSVEGGNILVLVYTCKYERNWHHCSCDCGYLWFLLSTWSRLTIKKEIIPLCVRIKSRLKPSLNNLIIIIIRTIEGGPARSRRVRADHKNGKIIISCYNWHWDVLELVTLNSISYCLTLLLRWYQVCCLLLLLL